MNIQRGGMLTDYPVRPSSMSGEHADLECNSINGADMGAWGLSHRFDKAALPIADRHYNRQKIGSPQFVPPGRCLVLKREGALWVTSWPFAQYTKHEWAGAWVNSCFRRESGPLASVLIRSAVAATLWHWSEPPALGLVTFIDRQQVRHKRDYGRCYLRAGFKVCGETKGNYIHDYLRTS